MAFTLENETIVAFIPVILYVAREWFKERRERRERQWALENQKRAAEERQCIMGKIDSNTELTAKTLKEAAKASGTPLEHAIHEEDSALRALMSRYIPEIEAQDAPGSADRAERNRKRDPQRP